MKKSIRILSLILLSVMMLTACERREDPIESGSSFGYNKEDLVGYMDLVEGYDLEEETDDAYILYLNGYDENNKVKIQFGADGYANKAGIMVEDWDYAIDAIRGLFNLFRWGECSSDILANIEEDYRTSRPLACSVQDRYNDVVYICSYPVDGNIYVELSKTRIDPEGTNIFSDKSEDSVTRYPLEYNHGDGSSKNDEDSSRNTVNTVNTAEIGTLDYIESVFEGEKTRDAYEIYGAYANTYDIEDDTVLTVIYDESGNVHMAYVTSTSDFPEDAAIELGRALGAVPTGIADSIEQTGEFSDSINGYAIVASYSDGQWFCTYDDGTIDVETQGQAANGGGEIYPEGMYRVGTDIPEGIYYIYTDSSCYWEVSSDSTGDFGSIIGNGNINNNAYVTVYEGQYLTVDRGSFYNIATREYNLQSIVGEGMYWVGHDIPAGEYVLTPEAGTSAYWAILSNSEARQDIMANGNEDTTIYITVSDGQFLEINRGSIELVQ